MNSKYNQFYTFLLCIFITFYCIGCVGTKFLKDDEVLLRHLKLKGIPTDISEYNLSEIVYHRPNSKFPLIGVSPAVWLYKWGTNNLDSQVIRLKIKRLEKKIENAKSNRNQKKTTKYKSRINKKIERQRKKLIEGNWLMKSGEPLAVFDSLKAEKSKISIKKYLVSEGYFDSKITIVRKVRNKKVSLIYHIDAGESIKLNDIGVDAEDKNIKDIIETEKPVLFGSFPKKYSQDYLAQKRNELELLLKDKGYFNFDKTKTIKYRIDTLDKKDNIIKGDLIVNNTEGYKQFYIDSVTMIVNHPNNVQQKYRKKVYENIHFLFSNNNYPVKPLSYNISLRSGQLYNYSDINKTHRDLINIDIFKYINFRYDTLNNKINTIIEASPLKQYQTNSEVGLDYNEQGFPAPFVNFVIKSRNLFKILDIWNFNAKMEVRNIPLVTDVNTNFLSFNTQGGVLLTLPQFIFPFGGKLRQKYKLQNLKTLFYFGGSFTLRPDYERTIVNTSTGYRWQNTNNSYVFKLNDLSLITTPFISQAFETRLNSLGNNGNNIRRTFGTSLTSNMSVERVITFNDYGIGYQRSSYLKILIESGGTFLPLYNDYLKVYHSNLEVYQYAKIDVDFRYFIPLSRTNALAFRIKAGVAYPYGDNRILPYEKYFFSGGSHGIRAWLPRRLGPGSHAAFDKNGKYEQNFEQNGEMQLEMNFEVRRTLIGVLKSAFFVDLGNIWNVTHFNDRPNSEFNFDTFVEEIAVGSGIGLRFDFSYLVLRLDVATKIYDPARPVGNKFFLSDGFYKGAFDNQTILNYNIGIGYPF